MTHFIVLFYMPDESFETLQAEGVAAMRKNASEWITWKDKNGNHIIDAGSPLIDPQRISANGSYQEGEEAPKAYAVMQAYTKEDLIELLKGHPHLSSGRGASIEILESLPFMPGK